MKKINQENNEHIFNFSQELRDRLKKMVKDRACNEMSDGEADIGLDKFARLMKVTIKIMDQVKEKNKKKVKVKNRKGQDISMFVHKSFADKPQGLAFVMHGLGGFKEQPHMEAFAEAFYDQGFDVVNFDATNSFGESGGDYQDASVTNHLEDLEDIVEWAKTKKWYKEPFYLIGHSLGGISTALYAEMHPDKVKGLAPISLVVSGALWKELHNKEQMANWEKEGLWNRGESASKPGAMKILKWAFAEDILKHDIMKDVDKLTMPVLLIVGKNDTSTPLEHHKILFKALPAKKELHVIKGAEHTFREEKHLTEIRKTIRKWIESIEQQKK